MPEVDTVTAGEKIAGMFEVGTSDEHVTAGESEKLTVLHATTVMVEGSFDCIFLKRHLACPLIRRIHVGVLLHVHVCLLCLVCLLLLPHTDAWYTQFVVGHS